MWIRKFKTTGMEIILSQDPFNSLLLLVWNSYILVEFPSTKHIMQANRQQILSHLNPAKEADLRAIALMPVDINLRHLYLKSFCYIKKIYIKSPVQKQINIRDKSHPELFTHLIPYHLKTWRFEKVLMAAYLVRSLKPHWVSRIPLTHKNQTRKWKPCIKIVLKSVRFATASGSFSKLLLEPQTITSAPFQSID